jgi:hypothetical protein
MFAAKLANLDEPTEYEICQQSTLLALQTRELGLETGLLPPMKLGFTDDDSSE